MFHCIRILAIPLILCNVLMAGAAARESRWKGDRIACATCHEELMNQFRPTSHGKAMEFGAKDTTCGSCHAGDLTKHMETADPQWVKRGTNESCATCHSSQKNMMFWRGSQHQTAGLGCVTCHSVHKPAAGTKLLAKKTQSETCFGCHGQVRKAMLQRSTHLFRDERGVSRMECSSCHNPHGSQADKMIAANSTNDKCYSCHTDKRGPFLWEHAPAREDCMSCHSPHGSNNQQLLAKRVPQLCQECHIQGRHQTVAGRPNAMWNINRGCLNCHTQVHGTNHPSGPILMR